MTKQTPVTDTVGGAYVMLIPCKIRSEQILSAFHVLHAENYIMNS